MGYEYLLAPIFALRMGLPYYELDGAHHYGSGLRSATPSKSGGRP